MKSEPKVPNLFGFLVGNTQKTNSPPIQQKQVVEEISQINILRESMLKEATGFYKELDDLQHQLIKKSNELQILTSKQMSEISQKNIALVEQFLKYQQCLIKKLQGKNCNWDKLQYELSIVESKLQEVMGRNELVSKLARIQVLQSQIQNLMKEVEDLKRKNESKRR